MAKLKNNFVILKPFVLFITFCFFISCDTIISDSYKISSIDAQNIPVSSDIIPNAEFEAFIEPYKNHINSDLDSILALAPVTFDKSKGIWETNIGNLMADICIEKGNYIMKLKGNKKIDICLLNHGGIRNIIPQGYITKRTAYEVMPFENSLIVLELEGKTIREMAEYYISGRKPHPLSGMEIFITKKNKITAIKVNGQELETEKSYLVATSDYLANGGDNMTFFMNNLAQYDLEYKIRNILIDYFEAVDTLPLSQKTRIHIK